MAIRKPEITESGYYFITFTCYKWLPLIELANGYDLVYKWFAHMNKEDHRVIGYVIMPNHLHLLLAYQHSDKSLNKVVGNGKRFLAYGLVKRLRDAGATAILTTLQGGVNQSDRKRNKQHELFADSFEVKHCSSSKFLLQKLNYIHNNPCSGKWNLVADVISYPHSSAVYYETGKQGTHQVSSWTELEEDGWWEQQPIPDVRES